jgi:hypothetical protein
MTGGGASALAVLRRIATDERPAGPPPERCGMCGTVIPDEHQHVVDTQQRSLMCACRPCYLLFTADGATLRYRAVPERYMAFADFRLGSGRWDELQIPVGLAFFFRHSGLGRVVALYPGPAGATESELPLAAWDGVVADNPAMADLVPDVEAFLVRADGPADDACYLVPIDRCYELVGELRRVWRGFDGGQEARQRIEAFFADVAGRCR